MRKNYIDSLCVQALLLNYKKFNSIFAADIFELIEINRESVPTPSDECFSSVSRIY